MKTKSYLAMSVLLLGVNGAAFSANTDSTFPADAEASFNKAALDTYADQQARKASGSESWGVGKRQAVTPHDPFPHGGGYIDD